MASSISVRLNERIGLVAAVSPTRLSTAGSAATSNLLDMQNVGQAELALLIGTNAGTAGVKLQHSTSTVAGDFQDFSPTIQATGITAGSVEQQILINAADMPGRSRYLRAIVTAIVTSTNVIDAAATWRTADPHYYPADNGSGVRTPVVADDILS
jgi:hypothetical protein